MVGVTKQEVCPNYPEWKEYISKVRETYLGQLTERGG
jgi:hypothetical protein